MRVVFCGRTNGHEDETDTTGKGQQTRQRKRRKIHSSSDREKKVKKALWSSSSSNTEVDFGRRRGTADARTERYREALKRDVTRAFRFKVHTSASGFRQTNQFPRQRRRTARRQWARTFPPKAGRSFVTRTRARILIKRTAVRRRRPRSFAIVGRATADGLRGRRRRRVRGPGRRGREARTATG